VSFNKEYGDDDDKFYITKKILVQKEKHLKFRDENNRIIEYRSASGLNYIIEDV
jgi:phage-related protein